MPLRFAILFYFFGCLLCMPEKQHADQNRKRNGKDNADRA